MIEAILPAEAATAEAFDDPPGLTLFPEEEAVIARAVGKRRREFTTTRACARTALARLGLPPACLRIQSRSGGAKPSWKRSMLSAVMPRS